MGHWRAGEGWAALLPLRRGRPRTPPRPPEEPSPLSPQAPAAGRPPALKGPGTCRAHPNSAHESGAEKLRPPRRRHHLPPASLPTHRGEGSGPQGSAAARAGRAGWRRVWAGAGAVAGHVPSHSLADQPLGRIAFKTSPSPPPGRAGGGRRAGRARRHVPPEPVRPHFLSPVPQLGPVPNSAPTFSLLVPTRLVLQTQPNFVVWVPDSG